MFIWETNCSKERAGSRQLKRMMLFVWGFSALCILFSLIISMDFVDGIIGASDKAEGWIIVIIMFAGVNLLIAAMSFFAAKNNMILFKFIADKNGSLWITNYDFMGYKAVYTQAVKEQNINLGIKALTNITMSIGSAGRCSKSYIKRAEIINFFEENELIKIMAESLPYYFDSCYFINGSKIPAFAYRVDKLLKVKEKGGRIKVKFKSNGTTRCITYSTDIANYQQLYDLLIEFKNRRGA